MYTVEDYLLTGKLTASFFLTKITLGKFTLVFDPEDIYSDDPYNFDMNYDYHDDPDFYICTSGIFDLCYNHLTWDEEGQTTLNKGFKIDISWPHEEEGYYGLVDPYILKRDDLFIALSELERFETDHDVTIENLSEQNKQDEFIASSAGSVIKLHTNKKGSYKDSDNYLINPKREKTLLTIIGALLEVISGTIREDIVEHPSIKNQTDLITKLSDLELKGLSVRTMQDIFPKAKRYFDNA